MTDVRTHGFGSKIELEEHLAELENDPRGDDDRTDLDETDDSAAAKELAWLRRDVALLRERLAMVQGWQSEGTTEGSSQRSWTKIALALVAVIAVIKVL